MSLMLGVRIFAVAMLGLAVAHSARVVLWSIAGHARVERRDLIGEALHGLGALGLGLGLLPGNTPPVGEVLVIGGALAWIAGAMVQPLGRSAPSD